MKKGSFTMTQIAAIILILIAMVIIILFVTGQWDKLLNMLGGVTTETNQSITTLDLSK